VISRRYTDLLFLNCSVSETYRDIIKIEQAYREKQAYAYVRAVSCYSYLSSEIKPRTLAYYLLQSLMSRACNGALL
jgi:hypothetical protein